MKRFGQTLSIYFQKIKHNGLLWTIKAVFKHIAATIFRYEDSGLTIYAIPLDKMPLIPCRLKEVDFRWVSPEQKEEVLALGDFQINSRIFYEYMAKDSRLLGAFLGDRLIGYTWMHIREKHFPNFEYSLVMTDKEAPS